MSPNASSIIFKAQIKPNTGFLYRHAIFLTFFLLLVLELTSTSANKHIFIFRGRCILT